MVFSRAAIGGKEVIEERLLRAGCAILKAELWDEVDVVGEGGVNEGNRAWEIFEVDNDAVMEREAVREGEQR